MDRLPHCVRRTLPELLVVSVLISCAWITGRSLTSTDVISPRDEGVSPQGDDGLEIEVSSPAPAHPPQFFQPRGTALWLPPLSDKTRQVLAVGCPTQPSELPRFSHDMSPPSPLEADKYEPEENVGNQPQLIGPTLLGNQSDQTNEDGANEDGASEDRANEDQKPHHKPAFLVENDDGGGDDGGGEDEVAENRDGSTGASLLLPPPSSAERSKQLEHIARQADMKTRHGFALAGRGAYFAARAEFVAALRLLAQGLDTEQQTTIHSRSLAAGLTTVKEVGDFIPAGSRLEAHLDVGALIDSHSTPVLKNCDTKNLTSLSAVRCYLTFAQEQLGVAAGQEVAGSMALHALGKLHGAMATSTLDSGQASTVKAAEAKAVTFYQAALLAFPENFMASNDLGVLLARSGNHGDAQAALRHSISVCPQSSSWHNLAVVYRRLGQEEFARKADWMAQQLQRGEAAESGGLAGPSNHLVRWVDPATFARSLSMRPDAAEPMPLRTASPWPSKNKRK